jgi:tetratricopeptide (TPR) repeat protein
MNKVLASNKIDSKIKHRMLNEFLIFIKDKPEFDKDLEKAISYFDSDKEVKVAKEIAKFYHNKSDWDKAIKYYEVHLRNNSEDFESQLLLLEVYTEKQDFTAVAKKAETLQELYPSQPQFYYYAGLAYNQLLQYKKAKDALEAGIDYVLDDKALEINFNIQLGEAWAGLGDQKKKETYFLKADALMKQK